MHDLVFEPDLVHYSRTMSGDRILDEVEQFWSSSAATFDEEPDHGLTDPVVRAAWRRHLESWLPPQPGRVADLGCGTGSLSLLAVELGATVIGVDLSPAMIDVANVKSAAAGHDHARFEVGDASDPAIDPESLDVVMARHLIWTLPDPTGALDRWIRLLKPGGRAIFIEGVWGPEIPADDPRRNTIPWSGGVPANTLLAEVDARFEQATLLPLSNEDDLWGKRVNDERYAIVADRPVC